MELFKKVLPGLVRFTFALVMLGAACAAATERQVLAGHLPPGVARLQATGDMAGTNRLKLAIGLPLRNQAELTNLVRQLYEPTSATYRRYLTPAQFAERFGPAEEDYRAAIAFAQTNGLFVTATHPNRTLLDVEGVAADVEKTFHVRLRNYPHPNEARTFYAPDREPSIDCPVRLVHVSGLDNYTSPHPMSLHEAPASSAGGRPHNGSGRNGTYFGNDFRTAYVPGTSLNGEGQTVGLFELNGYYPTDITSYETQAGLPKVPIQNVLIDGFNGAATGAGAAGLNEEVALDIEMVISMAPGLAKVMVYEASPGSTMANIDDLLNRMATDNAAAQLSCSWGFDIDEISQQIFLQYAAQGQSFFIASGDSGAFPGPVYQPSDNPYLTVVGGTELTTDASHNRVSETTWNGSSGGISTVFAIPAWQEGIDMSANQGSTTMRNIPDVAMVANNVLAIADRGKSVPLQGTSIAAPLWAGFTALVNQQAAAAGKPTVGFLNPALYAIGKSSSAAAAFLDITTGDNTSQSSPSLFYAAPGYDLCTGWGTPNGTDLIQALLGINSQDFRVSSPLGFEASGPVGGPFSRTSATYTLANAGPAPITWTVSSTATWLTISPANGTLVPGGPAATVSVSLNQSASTLLIGSYATTVSFSDPSDSVTEERQFKLEVGNGGFENGDFTDWTAALEPDANFADSVDATQQYGSSSISGVDDSAFVHSGIYGAFLGQTNRLGFLSQTLPTVAGQQYLLSFWLVNPALGVPNEFSASWNGTTVFHGTDMDPFTWTRMQYLVTAGGPTSVLKFGFRNDQNAFGLDDVSIQPVSAPSFTAVRATPTGVVLTWKAIPGVTYQVQYSADLGSSTWADLGDPVTATDDVATVSDTLDSDPARFYRIVLAQ